MLNKNTAINVTGPFTSSAGRLPLEASLTFGSQAPSELAWSSLCYFYLGKKKGVLSSGPSPDPGNQKPHGADVGERGQLGLDITNPFSVC